MKNIFSETSKSAEKAPDFFVRLEQKPALFIVVVFLMLAAAWALCWSLAFIKFSIDSHKAEMKEKAAFAEIIETTWTNNNNLK